MKTILITGIGGPTPRSIALTIRRVYPNYRIIGIDSNPKALGFFIPGLVDEYYRVPRVTEENYWSTIHGLIKEQSIDIAFVQPEVEVIEWGKYFDKNGKYPCPVLVPPRLLAETLMNKARMADILKNSKFIPKTIRITQDNVDCGIIEAYIGYPCWIRATQGSGGLGSLKIQNRSSLESWLFIHKDIDEFTISEFLSGRHLATQMLYFNGEFIKGAALDCVNYVMADIAPSKVTGNTSYGIFINDDKLMDFCCECLDFISNRLGEKLHGVLSFDLKLDENGNPKVTEVNIRHMAYTGIMAQVGLDLVDDTIKILLNGVESITERGYYHYDKEYAFLRDVDSLPVIIDNSIIINLSL